MVRTGAEGTLDPGWGDGRGAPEAPTGAAAQSQGLNIYSLVSSVTIVNPPGPHRRMYVSLKEGDFFGIYFNKSKAISPG